MGFMSRRVLPICGSMCVCCPALRPRSRQPVKRYKKLLAHIFPKSPDDDRPNERKIAKLCEYASKNPLRVPKIAKSLEQRFYKELRSEHFNFVKIVMETYTKLLQSCKGQLLPYFAVNLLTVTDELLDSGHQDAAQILGCQTLTSFIYGQSDGTYVHSIESMVRKVCGLARETGEGLRKRQLQAASLQCLCSTVWYMAEFSHMFADLDEIVFAVLDNYRGDSCNEGVDQREAHHNWVDEVLRCDTRAGACIDDLNQVYDIICPRPEMKDPFKLTREESESPEVWSRICIQKMVDLSKETTTMRRVLDPVFLYFDMKRHWVPRNGLAVVVLSDMSFLMETSGNEQLILASVVRHLDHKNFGHNPLLKSSITQIVTALARRFRSPATIVEISIVSDLCRHLRKSYQAINESAGQQELSWNLSLQSSIEDCLLEVSKRVIDVRLLFDMMAITLEKLPVVGTVARATVGSMSILAHITSLVSFHSYVQQGYPEALFLQLLKAMAHPDKETRIIAHHVFTVLLVPASIYMRHECLSLHMESAYEPRKLLSRAASGFTSASKLFEKLRRGKDALNVEKNMETREDPKERDLGDEDIKLCGITRSSPSLYRKSFPPLSIPSSISCLIDEGNFVRLNEDQMTQLFSALWIQANLPGNLLTNFAAMIHSYGFALLASRPKATSQNLIRAFQLPLSLMNKALDTGGNFELSYQRSIFTSATVMLMFAAKVYHIPELTRFLTTSSSFSYMDSCISITDDLHIYVKPELDITEPGSFDETEAEATSIFSTAHMEIPEAEKAVVDLIAQDISCKTGLDVETLVEELYKNFVPDDTFLHDSQSFPELTIDSITAAEVKESLSFDEDFPLNCFMEDSYINEGSIRDLPRLFAKLPDPSNASKIISVGQLLESALEAAGHVACASVSTSPLPYSTMASQCEELGFGSRKKLSSWLVQDQMLESVTPLDPLNAQPLTDLALQNDMLPSEPWQVLTLPPASPFDNFLKAAGC